MTPAAPLAIRPLKRMPFALLMPPTGTILLLTLLWLADERPPPPRSAVRQTRSCSPLSSGRTRHICAPLPRDAPFVLLLRRPRSHGPTQRPRPRGRVRPPEGWRHAAGPHSGSPKTSSGRCCPLGCALWRPISTLLPPGPPALTHAFPNCRLVLPLEAARRHCGQLPAPLPPRTLLAAGPFFGRARPQARRGAAPSGARAFGHAAPRAADGPFWHVWRWPGSRPRAPAGPFLPPSPAGSASLSPARPKPSTFLSSKAQQRVIAFLLLLLPLMLAVLIVGAIVGDIVAPESIIAGCAMFGMKGQDGCTLACACRLSVRGCPRAGPDLRATG